MRAKLRSRQIGIPVCLRRNLLHREAIQRECMDFLGSVFERGTGASAWAVTDETRMDPEQRQSTGRRPAPKLAAALDRRVE